MSDDAYDVPSEEPILRKIPKAQGYFDPRKKPPIERGAFSPNAKDIDGISCFLERLMSIELLVEISAPRPPSEIVIVRLRAKDFYDLGLTLRRTFDPGDYPGHVIVPELNREDYENQKQRFKPLVFALMILAEKHIVFDGVRLTE
jgi:hypothetical protein